jgi:hypothetical protein
MSHAFIQASEINDLCAGDTLTLFARIPDGTTCSYQWYQSYKVKPGVFYSGIIPGENNNKLFFSSSYNYYRTYRCKYNCGGGEIETD